MRSESTRPPSSATSPREAIAAAGVAAAQEQPEEVLRALAPLERMPRGDGVDDPAFLPWHHLKAHALVDTGRAGRRRTLLASAAAARGASGRTGCSPPGWPTCAAGSSSPGADLGRAADALHAGARDWWSRSACRTSRRWSSSPRAAAPPPRRAAGRRRRCSWPRAGGSPTCRRGPARERCEKELAACGLAPSAPQSRDYTALDPAGARGRAARRGSG